MTDYIDRQVAIDALEREKTYSTAYKDGYAQTDYFKQYNMGLTDGIKALNELPSAQPEQRWIPVSERLPEEDTEVLISYRYKEGEGDTSHVDIDITTYGQMYFGGNKVGNSKHWRAPFEYFHSNYEVIAWMPLPVPYKGEGEAHEQN